MVKIVSIVGARPQFVKCAPLSRELRKDHTEILVHTGQHYDPEMSDVFFADLAIPKPDYNLGVGSGPQGEQTGAILARVEDVLLKEKPDMVIVFGDTNSTLAGALAAAKLRIPIAHVEAGLRSFDRTMPEEINRVVTDHVSDLLFCPTETAVKNLKSEGITEGVHLAGDVMVDALVEHRDLASRRSRVLERFSLAPRGYLLLTLHRPANVDRRENLGAILSALGACSERILFPVHPRTRKMLREFGLLDGLPPNLIATEPLGYMDMIQAITNAKKVLTDSGGVQKEAYILGIPCITLRDTTEWVETVDDGWNILVGSDRERIVDAIAHFLPERGRTWRFGGEGAAIRMAETIDRYISSRR